MVDLLLSPKSRAFLRHRAPVEFLEGTTAAGKTTVALLKFMLRVAESPRRIHVLAGLDQGTVEKNVINKELGILEDFGALVEYRPSGGGRDRMPHLRLFAPNGEKTVYVLGYGDKARWKKALGGQYGCLYIDEINVADMDFVREAAMRCDYLLATLNPDDPGLAVYREYINRSRPLPQWEKDVPRELLRQLDGRPEPGWTHWFFGFDDNPALTAEKRARIIASVPEGTKLYKNKILGLRGRAEGLVFDVRPEHLITVEEAHQLTFRRFTAGLDTAYSQRSDDAFAFTFAGITADGALIQLAAMTRNNRDLERPLTPSDIPPLFEEFLEGCRAEWGFAPNVYIDSADQATILECRKTPSAYRYLPAWKGMRVVDRLHLQLGWMALGRYKIVAERCEPLLQEMSLYSWRDDACEPEDGHDHCINSVQYSFLPYKGEISAFRA